MRKTAAIDLDLLATHLRTKMNEDDLSIRDAAPKIGMSPATLARLLQGTRSPNIPDSDNLMKAVAWLGRSLSDFEARPKKRESSMAEVEVHLRALPNLSPRDVEAMVAMVRAAYESARELRAKKSPKR